MIAPVDLQIPFDRVRLCFSDKLRSDVYAGQIETARGKLERKATVAARDIENLCACIKLEYFLNEVSFRAGLSLGYRRAPEIERDAVKEIFLPVG